MATAHEIGRKLLAGEDLPLLDVYAEQTIVDVKKYSYEGGDGHEVDCIVYETDDFVPNGEEPEDEDPGEKEE